MKTTAVAMFMILTGAATLISCGQSQENKQDVNAFNAVDAAGSARCSQSVGLAANLLEIQTQIETISANGTDVPGVVRLRFVHFPQGFYTNANSAVYFFSQAAGSAPLTFVIEKNKVPTSSSMTSLNLSTVTSLASQFGTTAQNFFTTTTFRIQLGAPAPDVMSALVYYPSIGQAEASALVPKYIANFNSFALSSPALAAYHPLKDFQSSNLTDAQAASKTAAFCF